jgi:putative ABC transport system permease protein
MFWLRLIYTRLHGLLRKNRIEQEMEDEMRFHLRMRTRENIERGMRSEEAEREARRRFGNVGRIKDLSRDIKGGGFMEMLLQDLRYGARMLLKNPGFTIVASITLALGIGANTAIFSIVNAVLIRPLPYQEPDQLVMIDEIPPGGGQFAIAPGNFADWRDQSRSFVGMSAYRGGNLILTSDGGNAEQLRSQRISANFFDLLGIKPVLGRFFTSDEDKPDHNRVVIFSYSLWQRRFGGEPDIVGKMLTLDGNLYTVVGIMPANFRFSVGTEIWTPLALTSEERLSHDKHDFFAIARLKPNINLEHARVEMKAIAERLGVQYPKSNAGWGIRLIPLQEWVVGDTRPVLMGLLSVVAFVLLIACANIANLLLARSAARQREFAIRAALGASRWRVTSQLLTESLLLGVVGGLLGLLPAIWGINLLRSLVPIQLGVETIGIDGRALGFTFTISVFTSLLFGLAPTLQAARLNLTESLKEGGWSGGVPGRDRTRSLLVIAEIALSLALLVSAGLVVKSFIHLIQVNPGFQSEGLLTMQVSLPRAKYPEPARVTAFFDQLIEKIVAVPGVASVGAASTLPFKIDEVQEFIIGGRSPITQGKEPSANYYIVSPEYFRAMGIPLIEGRLFSDNDAKNAPRVALINETLARVYFPNEDPIGKRIDISKGGFGTWREIVGVVGGVKHYGLDSKTTMQIYEPFLQIPQSMMSFAVRVTGDTETIAAAIRNQVTAMDKDQPIANIRTMEKIVAASVSRQRFSALLFTLFAGVALILAAVGIYGVMSYYVTQRTREIGIRMALGAQTKDVLRLIVMHGAKLVLIGLSVGLSAALTMTRLMKRLLFDVEPNDPLTFSVITIMLTIVALLASWIPARRATKVDPITTIRSD